MSNSTPYLLDRIQALKLLRRCLNEDAVDVLSNDTLTVLINDIRGDKTEATRIVEEKEYLKKKAEANPIKYYELCGVCGELVLGGKFHKKCYRFLKIAHFEPSLKLYRSWATQRFLDMKNEYVAHYALHRSGPFNQEDEEQIEEYESTYTEDYFLSFGAPKEVQFFYFSENFGRFHLIDNKTEIVFKNPLVPNKLSSYISGMLYFDTKWRIFIDSPESMTLTVLSEDLYPVGSYCPLMDKIRRPDGVLYGLTLKDPDKRLSP